MILNYLSQHKFEWQTKVLDQITGKLIFADVERDRATHHDNKLVVMYGNTQIGKTTTILTLIGIDDNNIEEVGEILRSGREKGSSSTSTAILYRKSHDSRFGLSVINTIHDNINQIDYYERDEFEKQIQLIRDEIEKNANHTSVVAISIPEKYFRKDVDESNLVVLDMPGDETNDRREQSHVKALLKMYMSVSTVNILTVRANNIQSELQHLGKIEFIDHNWNDLPSKYIVLATHAFSEESTKSYFKLPLEKRQSSFYDYICKATQNDFISIDGFSDSKIEVYPLDVGASFTGLIKELSEKDKIEVMQTRDHIMKDLIASIRRRQTDSLDMVIKGLQEQIDALYKEIDVDLGNEKHKLQKREKEIPEEIEHLNKLKSNAQSQYSDAYAHRKEAGINFRDYLQIGMGAEQSVSEKYGKKMIKYLSEYSNSKDNFKDKVILDNYKKFAKDLILEVEKKYEDYLSILKIDSKKGVLKQLFESFSFLRYENEIDEYIYQQGRWFHFRNRPSLGSIKSFFEEKNYFHKIFEKKLMVLEWQHANEVKKKLSEIDGNILHYEKACKRYSDRITAKEDEQKEIGKRLNEIESRQTQLTEEYQSDKALLENYMQTAEEIFHHEQKALYAELNRKDISSGKKLLQLLMIGLNDFRYEKLNALYRR